MTIGLSFEFQNERQVMFWIGEIFHHIFAPTWCWPWLMKIVQFCWIESKALSWKKTDGCGGFNTGSKKSTKIRFLGELLMQIFLLSILTWGGHSNTTENLESRNWNSFLFADDAGTNRMEWRQIKLIEFYLLQKWMLNPHNRQFLSFGCRMELFRTFYLSSSDVAFLMTGRSELRRKFVFLRNICRSQFWSHNST